MDSDGGGGKAAEAFAGYDPAVDPRGSAEGQATAQAARMA